MYKSSRINFTRMSILFFDIFPGPTVVNYNVVATQVRLNAFFFK